MNITELRYIIEIAQCGSVSAASKRLYVAQPNISKAIRSLEEEYQIQLFVRTARGMVPTREGQQFIAQARQVIQEIEETFEIAIPEEEAEKIKTVGEAVELIRKTRNE